MALKRKLTSQPPTEQAALYKKISDTEWVLDLEGDDTPDPKLQEFRQTNIELLRKQKELEDKLAAVQTQSAPKDEENKTLSQKVDHLTKLYQESEQKTKAAEQRARQEAFRGSFFGVASKHKIRDDQAAHALYTIASTVFKENKEGKMVPQDANGNTLYSKKSTSLIPIEVEEWVESQKADGYKDFFQQPTGGGGRGSSGVQGSSAGPRISLTKAQASKPTVEQFKAMQEGRVDVED